MIFRFKTMRRTKIKRKPAGPKNQEELICKKRKTKKEVPEIDGETESTCLEHTQKMLKEMASRYQGKEEFLFLMLNYSTI